MTPGRRLHQQHVPADCTLTIGGSPQIFSACVPIPGAGAANLTLLWSLQDNSNGSSTLAMGLRAAASGWAAVGFPAEPARMLGSTAIVLQACPNCSSGAVIQDRFLAARSPEGVQPPGHLPVWGAAAAASGDGTMAGTMHVLLANAGASSASAFPLVFAAGQLTPGAVLECKRLLLSCCLPLPPQPTRTAPLPAPAAGVMRYHGSSRGGIEVDLAAGTGSGGDTGSAERTRRMKEVCCAGRRSDGRAAVQALAPGCCAACLACLACLVTERSRRLPPPALCARAVQAHGWLMAIGFGLLTPLGIVVARHGKAIRPPLWFHAHRAIQATGTACVLSAFILIFVLVGHLLHDQRPSLLRGKPAITSAPGAC